MLTVTLISVALGVFFAGNAIRLVKTLRLPAHLRWELYPIPKGTRERQRYGGSYFEDSDWWMKTRDTSHKGEATFIVKEVFLLRGVWENFRALWLWSWLLHWGLYLYLLTTLFAIAEVLFPTGSSLGILQAVVFYGYRMACPLGIVGALGLIGMRTWHARVRPFTTRVGIFNLCLLGSIFATGMLSLNHGSTGLDTMVRDLMRLPTSPGNHPAIWSVHLGLIGLFLAYFPFTHMTHAYMKYFTWHHVRWDDSPTYHNPQGANTLAVNLQRETSWAAQHVAAGGTATWSEVVADQNGNGAGKSA